MRLKNKQPYLANPNSQKGMGDLGFLLGKRKGTPHQADLCESGPRENCG